MDDQISSSSLVQSLQLDFALKLVV